MLSWIRNLFESSHQRQVRRLQEQFEKKLLEANLWGLDNLIDPREPVMDDPSFLGGTVLGDVNAPNLDHRKRGEAIPVYTNEGQLKALRDQSRRLLALNEFAINAVGNRQSYIAGKGYSYKMVRKTRPGEQPRQGPDPLAAQAQAVIDEFLARNLWGEKEQESIWRADEDGEVITRLFHVGRGRAEARFVEPEHLRGYDNPDPAAQFGILTEPDDVEKVLAYDIAENPLVNLDTTRVPACDVFHVKLNVKSNAKRGLPTMHPVRKNLQRAETLLRNMSVLATVQATFAAVRKHKQFGKTAISAFQAGQQDDSYQRPLGGRTQPYQQLLPGSIIDTNEFTDLDLPAARIDASGLVGVLQAELRAVAARLIMPEWMLTVDASNNNFASSLIAEAPSTRNFERLQSHYGARWGNGPMSHAVLWRVLELAVVWGDLPREALTELEIQAKPPTLTVRNKQAETARCQILKQNGVMSVPTWAAEEGLDHEHEKALGAKDEPGQQPDAGSGPHSPPKPAPPGAALAGASEGHWVWEACVPNKTGKGHHDDKTGHPCSPSGSDDHGGANKKEPDPKTPEEMNAAADQKVDGVIARCKDAIGKVLSALDASTANKPVVGWINSAAKWVGEKTGQFYGWLEGRYGRAGAITVFSSGTVVAWATTLGSWALTGVPIAFPGQGTISCLPALAIAEMFKRLRGSASESHDAGGIDLETARRLFMGWMHEILSELSQWCRDNPPPAPDA